MAEQKDNVKMTDVQVRGLDDGDANETLKLKSAEGEVSSRQTATRQYAIPPSGVILNLNIVKPGGEMRRCRKPI